MRQKYCPNDQALRNDVNRHYEVWSLSNILAALAGGPRSSQLGTGEGWMLQAGCPCSHRRIWTPQVRTFGPGRGLKPGEQGSGNSEVLQGRSARAFSVEVYPLET